MLALAVLCNGFIIIYSYLSEETTGKWNRAFTNFFTQIINNITQKETKHIPLENIDISFSNEADHKYNYLPNYELNEIPLGSAKQIECAFLPVDATNKSITYSVEPSYIATLNQSGSKVSVVGMQKGTAKVTAKSAEGDFESQIEISVVETKAPASYEISLESTIIPLGSVETLNIDIDGGNLGHNELINFRYYDITELDFLSSDTNIATVDSHGVIYPKSKGNCIISVKNKLDFSRQIEIEVVDGLPVPTYSNLSIEGSNVCYENDMINDQSSHNNHFQLTPKDGDITLDPEDFIWESFNPLLVRVDRHGVVRGFRKTNSSDEITTIKATSKLNKQFTTFDVVVKNQLPTEMYFSFEIGEKTFFKVEECTLSEGNIIELSFGFVPNSYNKNVIVNSSDTDVIEVTNEGSKVTLNAKKEGTCVVEMISSANPELSLKTTYTVVKNGAISPDNYGDVNYSLRKIVGHSILFAIAQTFTCLSFFMFLKGSKKWWLHMLLSFGTGLAIAGISEIIQFVVPSRHGAFLDILIDLIGIVCACSIVYMILFIKKKLSKKSSTNNIK